MLYLNNGKNIEYFIISHLCFSLKEKERYNLGDQFVNSLKQFAQKRFKSFTFFHFYQLK